MEKKNKRKLLNILITILIVFRLRAENGTKNLHNFVIALLCSIRYNDWAFSIALLQICKTQ